MAVALVAHTITNGSTSGGTSAAIDTTGSSLLVISIGQQGTDVTVSDSKSNTWTGLTAQGSSPKCRIFYASSPTVGTGHTFTVSGASTFSVGCVAAFSGVKITSPFESQNGTASGTQTIQPGSVTPAEDGALVVSAVAGGSAFNGGALLTIGSGFTKTDGANYVPSTSYGAGLAYLVQTTAAAVNPTWTNQAGVAMAASIGVFAPAVVVTASQARVMVMA